MPRGVTRRYSVKAPLGVFAGSSVRMIGTQTREPCAFRKSFWN
jgi:hypothetical protein